MELPSFFSERIVHCNEECISFDKFLLYLKENHNKTEDQMKKVESFNIERTLNGYREGIITPEGGVKLIPLFSALRFIFATSEKLQSCKQLGERISNLFANKQPRKDETVFDLYCKITEDSIINDEILKYLKCGVTIIESDIPSLYTIHKDSILLKYGIMAWERICIFERQFSSTHSTDLDINPDKITEAKWKYYQTCTTANKLGKELLDVSQRTIQRRIKRKERGSAIYDMVHICANNKHLPQTVESEITCHLQAIYPDIVDDIICVDDEASVLNNSVQLYLCCKPDIHDKDKQTSIAKRAHHICKKHNIAGINILFFPSNTFGADKSNRDRFTIRDDIIKESTIMFKLINTWIYQCMMKLMKMKMSRDKTQPTCAVCVLKNRK
jgi:hypothetical protein